MERERQWWIYLRTSQQLQRLRQFRLSCERRINREQAEVTLAKLKSKGMLVNDISPAEMQRIRERTSKVLDLHGKAIGDEAVTMVFAELKRIRGQ